ncbi:tyrosine-protein phosphatase [Prescottella subtropica]|uniref:tyrosine-protein phosphatase n=1 Tax=Prescottella subtropica TaxID=2545757 RepID=UPI001F4F5BB1|nr:tyrosine-protein phosphatase [Prescottella subtropica]
MANFRDVSGTGAGYTGAGGAHLNKGLFYRSDAIVPDDADLATLGKLGLSTIYDLRSDDEVADKPNRLPDGVDYVRIPILSGNVGEMVDQIRVPEDARNMMRGMNRDFVTGAAERAGFATLLTAMADTDGGQVFHCTAGKDRTGWTAMLLQHIAGVDDATIMQDYLLTNEYNKEWVAKTRAYLVATQGEAAAALLEPLFGVEASYLQAGLDELAATYGTVDAYLTEGLGLSADMIGTLRTKLLG